MSEFKDSEGRKWRINLTLGGVKKVMDELGINLLDLTQFADTSDGSATLKLVNDDRLRPQERGRTRPFRRRYDEKSAGSVP